MVHTAHVGDPSTATEVAVTYVKGGSTYRVRGGTSCWRAGISMIPYLCPDMPATQREALAYGIKAPIVYTSVLVRDWTAFAKLGVPTSARPAGITPSVQLPSR